MFFKPLISLLFRSEQDRKDCRSLLAAAYPLIVINLASTGMQFTDAWMVSVLGKESLAAVLPAGLMYLIPVSFGWGLMSALNTFVAQSLGRNEPLGCGQYTIHGLLMAVFFGCLVIGLWPLSPVFFRWMDHEPAVQALENEYFRISLMGAAPALIVAGLSNFFTGLQKTLVLMAAAIGATLLNIFFNWLFIYGNWGCPRLEVAGSALGTVLATVCQAVFLLIAFWQPHLRRLYGTARCHLRPISFWQIVRIGAPAGGQFVFDLFTWGVLIIWMIGLFGTNHLAANTIAVRYLHLAFMPPLAVGGILTARVGQAIGNRQPDRADAQTALVFRLLLAYMGTIGLVFILFRGPLMGLFTEVPEIIEAGGLILICAAGYQVFDAMYITYSHALRGAGDAIWQAGALILYSIVLLTGGAYAMVTYFPELASMGPWLATTFYVIALGSTLRWRWRRGTWRRMDIFK